MPIVVSATAAIFTYVLLMQLLFEDFDEFRKKVRSLLEYLPISVVADWAFGRDSLRSWIWMVSGPVMGVIVYTFVAR
jgi:hypothetical protein